MNDTVPLNDYQDNNLDNSQKSKVTAEFVLSIDVENLEKTVQMPEYHLLSEKSTVNNVESVSEDTTNMIEFNAPTKSFFKTESYNVHDFVAITSNLLRPAIVFLTIGLTDPDTNLILPAAGGRESNRLLACSIGRHPMIISLYVVWSSYSSVWEICKYASGLKSSTISHYQYLLERLISTRL